MPIKRIHGGVAVVGGIAGSGRVGRGVVLFALFVCVMAADARAAFAQGGGRQIEAIDWAYLVPLAIGCVIFVIVVDLVVILKFVRRK